jgi:hypothetical protein
VKGVNTKPRLQRKTAIKNTILQSTEEAPDLRLDRIHWHFHIYEQTFRRGMAIKKKD